MTTQSILRSYTSAGISLRSLPRKEQSKDVLHNPTIKIAKCTLQKEEIEGFDLSQVKIELLEEKDVRPIIQGHYTHRH